MTQWEVIVIGGGPAGLMAAQQAAQRGRKTLLVEKNRRPGAKILLSGGTRCNLTHATDARGIVEAFGPQGRFLHSAVAALGPQDVIDLFAADGVPTKVEEGGKVFPRSDRAADVLAALLRRLKRSGCTLATDEAVETVQRTDVGFRLATSQRTLLAEKLILATGGRSYPKCGTTGDGYGWAAALGHTIAAPRTALVPITTHAPWVRALQGITVPDVLVKVVAGTVGRILNPPEVGRFGKPAYVCLAERRGAVLFAHFGLSGPAVLDLSRVVSGHAEPQSLWLVCDFLPTMTTEDLDGFLLDQCAAAGRRQIAGILGQLMPQRLAETVMELACVSPDCRAAEFAKEDRRRLAAAVKQMAIPVAGTMGFNKAEVTAGGVSLDEVDSRTVQSRLVPGLFFAGELLDLDGPIGGYNFQAAFSTGWLAGESV